MVRTLCAALLAAACFAAPVGAQQPTQRQVDSLAAQLRALRARLDSVVAELARQRGTPAKRDTAVSDDLAALRAAAAAAAGPDTTPAADTASGRRFSGRERSLNQLNPEISAVGNFHGRIQTRGAQQNNFELREVEFSFQSALDPYSNTKIFAGVSAEGIEIEEGYFYYTGLPARLRLDLGVFRQPLGELNRWHLHAVPETEYPLVLTTFTGDEGLAGAGASLYRAFGWLGTHEVFTQVTLGSNEALFDGGNRPAYLVHLNNFWQLSRSTYVQVGATGVYGTNPDTALKTMMGGVDFRLTWRPPGRALYRDWTLRGEVYGLKKERGGGGDTRLGGYLGTSYRLDRRWIAGARYDYVETPEGPGPITRQIVPTLTWWQSEFVFLRAEFTRRLTPIGADRNRLLVQAVWAMGPHKHETY